MYKAKSMSPRERAEFDNLKAENAELKEVVREQEDALIELAGIIAEMEE